MPYFSVSAKTGENVEESFSKVGDLALERNVKNDEMPLPQIQLIKGNEKKKKKKCC